MLSSTWQTECLLFGNSLGFFVTGELPILYTELLIVFIILDLPLLQLPPTITVDNFSEEIMTNLYTSNEKFISLKMQTFHDRNCKIYNFGCSKESVMHKV